jgi:uncharacterized membrane protein YphA (DoxX/SURF4 family)
MAGVALAVLRSVVAITIVVDVCKCSIVSFPDLIDAFVVLMGLCLLLGFLTPYCATLSCLVEMFLLVAAAVPGKFELAMSALTAAAAAVLGPGAYSLDARLFGRKLIQIPPRRNLQ